ncbi:hypothetical protein RhiirA1_477068 [Rhizophagus irregularis]|uniref:Uncharacterized protein n=2 Tax=Rhizophagus irregularis TaxID=588596 RepID=A0A2N0QU24_9GLOM|nr:hypothetical protein RhiirA1_477068 [Rhizophagus irregularis]GBC32259.1 hypothetical protein RIR_e48478_A0A2N0QU24_9GLOM [Rhizophagus irregularis DAOM 181602=DAOM 197198]
MLVFNDPEIFNFNESSLIFIIHKVYKNDCLSVECLSLTFPPSKEHFNEFEKLLKIAHR